jgi:hypothetical protein
MTRFFPIRLRLPSFARVAAVLSLLGAAIVCFVAGAAVMHFGLFSSDFLRKAFSGGETWLAQPGTPSEPPDGGASQAWVVVNKPEAIYQGLTLYTNTHAAEARLIDLDGHTVHQWKMPSARPWPKAAQVRDPAPGDLLHWERCHVYPNGDVLVLCCCGTDSPYGYGLAKLDKDSNLLWGYSANAHHDVTVADDGRIYVLTDRAGANAPSGVAGIPAKYIADFLVILSPEGKELDTIPILEAFRDSPYFLTLLTAQSGMPSPFPTPGMPGGPGGPGFPPQPPGPGGPPKGAFSPPGFLTKGNPAAPMADDVLHANSVKVLSQTLAPKFSLFKPGQVLLSLRSSSVLAIVDPETHNVTWAARGIWQYQHDAQFLDNGKLLLFDNFGSAHGVRVIEYDPLTQSLSCPFGAEKGTSFVSGFRGTVQRLPNGNTLIVNAVDCKLMEVTAAREIVWQYSCPAPTLPPNQKTPSDPLNLTGAWRYGPTELKFLKGGTHVQAN